MSWKSFSPCAVAAAALVMTGTLFGPEARAITDTAFRYSQPRTGHLMLGPANLVPDDENAAYSRVLGRAIATTSTNVVCFYAAVHLPHLATVTKLSVFYTRPTEADTGYISLRRLNPTSTSTGYITDYPPVPLPVARRGNVTYPADPATSAVNNQKFRYDLELCISKDAQFYSARIDYTYTHAGD